MRSGVPEHKARGAFFTPAAISQFMVKWALRSSSDMVLEPSCGDAAFLLPAAERLLGLKTPRTRLKSQLHGVDIHPESCARALSRLKDAKAGADIRVADFFEQRPNGLYDAVVGNPPYIRYQDFSGEARATALRAALSQGVRLNGLASSWAAFTIHASQFLKDSGRLAFVLPAELLSVKYAAEVRRFLLRRFANIRLIVFEELVFPDALEDVVLLLAEGRGPSTHFEVYQAKNAADLSKLVDADASCFSPDDQGKWTPALLPHEAFSVYRELMASGSFSPLIEWGDTYLGAVTGSNNFFSLSAAEAAQLKIPATDLLPISPPGTRHLRGLQFTKKAWQALAKEGARCYLFYPPNLKLAAESESYIAWGERERISRGYKCRSRKPWWRVPLVQQPDLFFTYMNHDRPRLTANEAGVHIVNSLYGIKLEDDRREIGKELLPIAALNSATLLGAEIVGRAYGGGLLKHEPKEADQLPVPNLTVLEQARAQLKLLRPQLAAALRRNDVATATQLVDGVLLREALKLSETQIGAIRHARDVLFQRRATRGKTARG